MREFIILIILIAAIIMVLMLGICEEQGLRELKYEHRRKYNAWMEQRALNQHITANEIRTQNK